MKDRYLGDGVYARHAALGIVLYLHDGYGESNHIVLDADVLNCFLQFVKDVVEESKKPIE